MLERTKAKSPFFTADHDAFRDVMRRFVSREGATSLQCTVRFGLLYQPLTFTLGDVPS